MKGQRIRKISIWLVTALYLPACVAPFSAAPSASLTQMPVGTVIAQTAAAAQTQTSIFLPTITFTPTSTPTFTPTKTSTSTPTLVPLIILPFLWTATPTVTLSLTQAGTASSENGTDGAEEDDEDEKSGYSSVIDKEWACTVLKRSPPNGAIIGRGVRFSAAWTVLNRGVKVWPNDGVDFRFRAGVRNEGKSFFDLPSTVITGGQITLDVTITAPKDPGAYRSIWTLKVGRTSFCKMGINFVVK